jgi:hypothetical protein
VRYLFITSKKEFELPLGTVYIGRSPDCFVQLEETAASRIHVKITRTSQEVILTDLGSLNGTFLNGDRVHDARRLQDGDMVRIADAFLVYKVKPNSVEVNFEKEPPRPTIELVFCPRCGGSLVAGSEMCGHCDHSVPIVKAVTQAAVCGSCQSVQAKAARFCGNCGREIRMVKIGAK